MDIVNTFSLDEVKVKFKGSKLAVGSSKMPSAVVDRIFMETLTPLNKSMVEGAAAFVATKKKKKSDSIYSMNGDVNHASQKRKVATRGTDVSSQVAPQANFENSCLMNGNYHINDGNMTVIDGEDDERRDRTLGGLRPSQVATPSTYLSSFHAVRHNRKQFTKLVEAIDPADMEVTCDYDFWLWLEAQNLFAPFSYKTHDLSVLALQDIGGAAVKGRWHQPPLLHPPAGNTSAVASSSSSFPSSFAAGAVTGALPCLTQSDSSAEAVAREICDPVVDNRLVVAHVQQQHQLHHQQEQPFPCLLSGSGGAGAGSCHVNGLGGSHPCLPSSSAGVDVEARSDCSDCYWDSSGDSAFSFRRPPNLNDPFSTRTTTSSAPTASRHTTTAQGIDDTAEDTINNHKNHTDTFNNNYFNTGSHHPLALQGPPPLRTENPHKATLLQGPLLDDQIAELNEELLTEHQQVNALLARLRRHALQGPAARGELEEANRRTERDKAVLARWRKANNSIHHGTGGNNGNSGIGKAKPSHKKKLGTY